MVNDAGDQTKYVIFVPHVEPPSDGKGFPVWLFLNGFGENGYDGISQIKNNFGRPTWEMAETFPFIAVAPQCSKKGSWAPGSADEKNAMDVLDRVLADFPCDEDRVYLTGVSSGSVGVFHFITQYPRRFAAIVPVATVSYPGQAVRLLAKHRIPAWAFFNSGDDVGNVERSHALRKGLYDNGCDHRVTEYERDSHNSWDYAYRDPAMYRWALQQSLTKNANASGFISMEMSLADDRCLIDVPIEKLGQCSEIEFEATFDNCISMHFTDKPGNSRPSKQVVLKAADDTSQLGSVSKGALAFFNSAISQAAVRRGNWNHVKLLRLEDQIEIEINGWPALSFKDLSNFENLQSLEISSDYGISSTDPTMRFVRYRRLPELQVATKLREGDTSRGYMHRPTGEISIGAVRSQLEKRAERCIDQRTRWQVAAPVDAMQFIPGARVQEEGRTASLAVLGDGIHFVSSRRFLKPLGHASVSDASLVDPDLFGKTHEEEPTDYSEAIDSGFSIKQDFHRPWRRFERLVSTEKVTERLGDEGTGRSTVLIRKVLLQEPRSWARLTSDRRPAEQLDTLHGQAALISVGAIDRPPLSIDFGRLKDAGFDEVIGGHRCTCVSETHATSPQFQRLLWVDTEGRIRRYQAKVASTREPGAFKDHEAIPVFLGQSLIEPEYDSATSQPTGWTIVNKSSSERPLLSVGSAKVSSIEHLAEPETVESLASSWNAQPGAWISNEMTQEQFVVQADGDHTFVAMKEPEPAIEYDASTATNHSGPSGAAQLLKKRLMFTATGAIFMLPWLVQRRRQRTGRATSE